MRYETGYLKEIRVIFILLFVPLVELSEIPQMGSVE
jgi:hypothetical protein